MDSIGCIVNMHASHIIGVFEICVGSFANRFTKQLQHLRVTFCCSQRKRRQIHVDIKLVVMGNQLVNQLQDVRNDFFVIRGSGITFEDGIIHVDGFCIWNDVNGVLYQFV